MHKNRPIVRATARAQRISESLRQFGLGFPGAREDHPWGEVVLKAKDKVFVFLGRPAEGKLSFSVKLPRSGERLLDQDCSEPTGYGLGKSGWITLSFEDGQEPPEAELCAWIEESYRAVAQKTLVKELDARGAAGGGAVERKPRKAAPAKRATKRSAKPRTKRRS